MRTMLVCSEQFHAWCVDYAPGDPVDVTGWPAGAAQRRLQNGIITIGLPAGLVVAASAPEPEAVEPAPEPEPVPESGEDGS